ncbi:MAG: oxidoreductase [Phycisphaeraceae bacterium]|nr:oxidoreductase [Phycisphaeraceae bacterium]
MTLEGKSALITGASAGIGESTALLYARHGAKVAVNGASERGQAVADAIRNDGGEAIFIRGRVEDADEAKAMVDRTVEQFGRLDILFNNAGIVVGGRAETTEIEDFDRMMAVNVRGVFLVSKFAVQQMLEQGGGVIIHNASVAAVKGLKDRFGYSTSKGAVMAMTKAMAMDYIRENIRVNCINPGTTLTPSLEGRIQSFDDPEAARKMFIERQPMGRLGKPEEIAAAALYLASDEAGFVTGQTINVDGGLTV